MLREKPMADDALARQVLELAEAQRLTLATVESCTGGLVAHLLTTVPGSSAVFRAGLVTYHNDAKIGLVQVSGAVLDTVGAVSAPCAGQMAAGGVVAGGADLAVAITGVAGPAGGTPEKPVGTVYWAIARRNEPAAVVRGLLPWDRSGNQRAAAMVALRLLVRNLSGEPLATPCDDIELTDVTSEYRSWQEQRGAVD